MPTGVYPRKLKIHCLRGHLRANNVDSRGHCLTCRSERINNWYNENPEKARELGRKWREDNPDYGRNYRQENAEHIRVISIANNSGISVEMIRQYLLERGDVSVCDICQQECPTGKRLALDHDHETNEIRGLLCAKCNQGLGMFNDSIKLMEIAAEYLKNKGAK